MTARRPFDPTRIRRPTEPKPASGGPATLTVRQVNELLRGVIAQHVPATLHVLGEIGDLSRPTSGHLYFTLKDAHSELRCVMWRSTAAQLRFDPEPGLEVIATGTVEVYPPRGTYQLIARKLEPRGVGALEIAFRQLRERLEREGLFAPERKRPLPRIPERIALVTSPSGAAIRDILHTLARRYPVLEILVYPVRVQGEGAAQEIADAVRMLNADAAALGGIDLAIVGRGGGSLEDLWPFNEEIVARAIAASRVPIVSAVGHEVDVTISDLVADLRAPTPTAAAELVTPQLTDLVAAFDRQRQRATRFITHATRLAQTRLDAVRTSRSLARPQALLAECRQLTDETQNRLRIALERLHAEAGRRLDARQQALARYQAGGQFARARQAVDRYGHRLLWALSTRALQAEHELAQQHTRLERLAMAARVREARGHLRQVLERLELALRWGLSQRRRLLAARAQAIAVCSPRRILERGYSLTRHARSGRVIRSVAEIHDGLQLDIELSDGHFRATAEDPRQPGLFYPPTETAPPPCHKG